MAGRVVPRRSFPASAIAVAEGDANINARLKNKNHMNLSESIGFFGESSSKIINTSILGGVKLEIVFTSQIACCIAGSAAPVDTSTPIYAQAANTFENQNNNGGTDGTTVIAADLTSLNTLVSSW
jgi:hypothetical protein